MKGMWEGRWVEVWARFLAQVTGPKMGTWEKQRMWKPTQSWAGRTWAERAQAPTLGQLFLRRFSPLLPLGFHEFRADGPLVLAVMLQGGVGQRWL